MAHLRLCMALLAFVALVLNGVFFWLESLALQLAIVEWVFCITVMVFYGLFAIEFGGMSGDTTVMLCWAGKPGAFIVQPKENHPSQRNN
ncbi:transmembrane protein 150A-like isoform X2 [Gouania willdenowi]|uniref:transmembrane protein 150A-like isoform X2 n=1 Tax=Gouania willdenowi TaxID=441366 RepID=UPI001056728B|nr:transmembrane protein 150A-like isoform X2 [Gouania willdenowi]